MKGSAVFIVGYHTRSAGQLVLKKPELPHGFQQSIFKGRVREARSQGRRSAYAQFSDWLMVR